MKDKSFVELWIYQTNILIEEQLNSLKRDCKTYGDLIKELRRIRAEVGFSKETKHLVPIIEKELDIVGEELQNIPLNKAPEVEAQELTADYITINKSQEKVTPKDIAKFIKKTEPYLDI